MRLAFYVVDEHALGEEPARAALAGGPRAVVEAIVRHAGPCKEAGVKPEDFAAVFNVLDRALCSNNFLADLAFAGSPQLVLTGHPGSWRLGYFEASLVQHLQPVFNALDDRLDADVAALPDAAKTVYQCLRQCTDDAFLKHAAVAIVHLGASAG